MPDSLTVIDMFVTGIPLSSGLPVNVSELNLLSEGSCLSVVYLMTQAVKEFGCPAWMEGQEEACVCRPLDSQSIP